MIITQTVKMDFSRRDPVQRVVAKQYDALSRAVLLELYDKSVAWTIPSGSTAVIRFRKPDGKGGVYDQLPNNGGPAYQIVDGSNSITIDLAPEVLTCAGNVLLDVVLLNGSTALATFGIVVVVERSPQDGLTPSNDYYNYSTLQDLNDAIANLRAALSGVVRSVNGVGPDEDGDVTVSGGGSATGNYLLKSGGTMTGMLRMDNNPILLGTTDGARVAGSDAGVLTLSGGGEPVITADQNEIRMLKEVHLSQPAIFEQTGDAGFGVVSEGTAPTSSETAAKPVMALYGTHQDEAVLVRGIATPEADGDAANKAYVDTQIANSGGSSGDGNSGVSSVNGQSGAVSLPTPGFGQCHTAAATQVKTVNVVQGDQYMGASPLCVQFDYANTAERPQLALNGEGGIPIYDSRTNTYAAADTLGAQIHTFLRFSGIWWLLDPVVSSGSGGQDNTTIPVYNCGSAGAAQEKSCIVSSPIPHTDGYIFAVRFASTNTNASPVLVSVDSDGSTLDSTPFAVIRAAQSAQFAAGNIAAGIHIFMVYNSNFALLLNPYTGT